jgi:hypothetical protein
MPDKVVVEEVCNQCAHHGKEYGRVRASQACQGVVREKAIFLGRWGIVMMEEHLLQDVE